MDKLEKEINELKEFIIDLKADRAATKEKEKREAWTKYVSLTVVIIAVVGAVASPWAAKFGSQTQMSQIKASDQWAYYQSKSVKQHLDEVALAEIMDRTNNPVMAAAAKKLVSDLSKYEADKAKAMADAKAFEAKRDASSLRGGMLATSVSLFSVSIAVASICTVTKKKPLWFISMLMAAAAIAQMVHALM